MSHLAHARAVQARHNKRAGGFGNGLTFNPFPFPTTSETPVPTTPALPEPTTTTTDLVPVIPTTRTRHIVTETTTQEKTVPETSTPVAPLPTTTSALVPPPVSPVPSLPVSPSVVLVSPASSSVTSLAPLSSPSPSPTTLVTIKSAVTHKSIPITTTYTGAALHNPLTVTHVVAATAIVSGSASALPSASVAPTNALVGPVIGGVAGGIAGLALIILGTLAILRRRNKDDTVVDFDPGVFRRSAVMLNDPPTHQDTIERGYNAPAPPPMSEKSYPMYGDNFYPTYPVSPNVQSPSSGNPLVFEAPYSPMGTPEMATPYENGQTWGPPAPVLTRTGPPTLSRNLSTGPVPENQNGLFVPEAEYMDLERTSVTPFQAVQYAEISRHLNSEVPQGLPTPELEKFVDSMPAKDVLPPLPTEDRTNPFGDDDDDEGQVLEVTPTMPASDDLSFPSPPPSAHTVASRYRVESMPPTLPDIVVESRVSVNSEYFDQAKTLGDASGQTLFVANATDSPVGNRFPVSPSPLASSFTMSTPPATESTFAAPAVPAPVATPRADSKNRRSIYTVYDPEDAYGGF